MFHHNQIMSLSSSQFCHRNHELVDYLRSLPTITSVVPAKKGRKRRNGEKDIRWIQRERWMTGGRKGGRREEGEREKKCGGKKFT